MGDLTPVAATVAPELTTVGPMLKAARQAAGLLVGEVAERAGLWDGLLIAIEAGERRPALPVVFALLRVLTDDLATRKAIINAAIADKRAGRGGDRS